MGDFLETETFRVLEDGFDGPPATLERGQTAVFAATIRDPYGAVFFVRRWRDDNWDTDCTVARHRDDGTWIIGGFGGGGWWDPFERPADGWDGDPVVWGGKFGSDLGDDDEEVFVQALQGMASPAVAKLEIYGSEGNLFDVVDIRDDTGVFVAIVIGDGPHTVVAKSADGGVLRDAQGREVRDVFDPDEEEVDAVSLMRGDSPEDHGVALGAVGKDDQGRSFVDSSDRGMELVTDPDIARRLERRFSERKPWPRRVGSE